MSKSPNMLWFAFMITVIWIILKQVNEMDMIWSFLFGICVGYGIAVGLVEILAKFFKYDF